ncbi:MAG TPA: hypothetical protein VHC49_18020 [Mycobacteriales bacterium]|nr:hypothetical protein [Mycobacteriales bacterium]
MNTSTVLATFEARLPERDVVVLRSIDDGGEYGEFSAQLLAALVEENIPVSTDERDTLARMAREYGDGSEYLPRLTVKD